MAQPILTTERLLLRAYRDGDFDGIHAYASDPLVCRFVTFGPNAPEQTREWMAQVKKWSEEEPLRHYEFLVTLKDSGQVIGSTGLTLDVQSPKAEVGYCFAKAYWGRGYATEAVKAVLSFAFGVLKLHRVSAPVALDNKASANVAGKCGMTREGRFRQSHFIKGSWWDIDYYAMLDVDWQQNNDQ